MKNRIVLSSVATIALMSLIGCGGGSSPSNNSNNQNDSDNPSVNSTDIDGVAVDDLILNGIVTAKDTSGTLLAQGRTSATDGLFTLNVAHSGIVLLNVTCDESSTMVNPTTQQTQNCGSDVTLNSLADVKAGVNQTVNLSPLTEIVYQRAVAQAGNKSNLTETVFDDARNEIGLMFGVDPIADNPTTGVSSQIIGAIHSLADEDTSIIAVTNTLADQLSDGEANGEADAMVLALTEAMITNNLTNNLTDSNGTYTPPEDPIALSDIAMAQKMFTDLRTQAMSVVDYDGTNTPGFMDTEAETMDDALNSVAMDIGVMGEYLSDIADGFDYLMESNRETTSKMVSEAQKITVSRGATTDAWSYVITEDDVEKWSGRLSIPEVVVGDDAVDVLYTEGTLTMSIEGTLPLYSAIEEEQNIDEGAEDSQSFSGDISITKMTRGATMRMSGKVASNGTIIEIKEANAEIGYHEGEEDEYGEKEQIFDYFKLYKLEVQGIVDNYTIDGSLVVNSYVQNNILAPKGGLEETETTSFNVTLYCDTSAIDTSTLSFSYEGVSYSADDEYSDDFSSSYGFYNLPIENDYTTIQNNIDYTATCTDTTETPNMYLDSWSYSETKLANSGWLPNDITFEGAIARTGASLEGTLNATWLNATTMNLDSDDTPYLDVSFNGKLQMPESPEMLLTLTFENSATANLIGATYTYDTTVITANATFDEDMENGEVSITTHTGINATVKVEDGEIMMDGTSTLTKDGALVGRLEERQNVPVIKYVDGSFESLP